MARYSSSDISRSARTRHYAYARKQPAKMQKVPDASGVAVLALPALGGSGGFGRAATHGGAVER
jgi:hypothetical protein